MYEDARNLEPGDHLYYSAGLNEHHCEAQVTLVSVGSSACRVTVDNIVAQGEQSIIRQGQEISAGWSELEITVL